MMSWGLNHGLITHTHYTGEAKRLRRSIGRFNSPMTLQPVAAASGKEDMVVQVPQVPQERSEGGVGVGSLDLRSGMTATDATSPSTFVSDVGTAATECASCDGASVGRRLFKNQLN